jgi:hypothetical protein
MPRISVNDEKLPPDSQQRSRYRYRNPPRCAATAGKISRCKQCIDAFPKHALTLPQSARTYAIAEARYRFLRECDQPARQGQHLG